MKEESIKFRLMTSLGWGALVAGASAYLMPDPYQNYQVAAISWFISSGFFMLRDDIEKEED